MESNKLSIIIPVFNEKSQLLDAVTYMFQSSCPIEREWIFVDDCSTDGSDKILQDLQTKYSFNFIRQQKNLGKGAAVRKGIETASGNLIMIQDADFEYDPGDVPSLLQPLLENKADVVFGSRFKKTAFQVHRTYHYFVNKLLTFISNLLSGIYLTDMETCYKIFRTDLVKSFDLKSQKFGIEVELTAYTSKTTARIFELPIHYYPRNRLQGKKINWRDGVAALFHLVRFNFMKPGKAFRNMPQKYLTRSFRRPQIEDDFKKIESFKTT